MLQAFIAQIAAEVSPFVVLGPGRIWQVQPGVSSPGAVLTQSVPLSSAGYGKERPLHPSRRDRIADVRAYVPVSGREGGDYHARPHDWRRHWIVDSLIANPLSKYPQYREKRTSWGIDALGGLIVEIETAGGRVGIGVSQGGDAACYLIERHLARFLLGADPRAVELLWDQVIRGSALQAPVDSNADSNRTGMDRDPRCGVVGFSDEMGDFGTAWEPKDGPRARS
jgi:hypothetical protein